MRQNTLLVSKQQLAENGDYNLSTERYREQIIRQNKWPMVELGTVVRLVNGRAYKQEELLTDGPTPVLRVGNFFSNRSWYYSDLKLEEDKYCNVGDLLYAWSASFGPRIGKGPEQYSIIISGKLKSPEKSTSISCFIFWMQILRKLNLKEMVSQ